LTTSSSIYVCVDYGRCELPNSASCRTDEREDANTYDEIGNREVESHQLDSGARLLGCCSVVESTEEAGEQKLAGSKK